MACFPSLEGQGWVSTHEDEINNIFEKRVLYGDSAIPPLKGESPLAGRGMFST